MMVAHKYSVSMCELKAPEESLEQAAGVGTRQGAQRALPIRRGRCMRDSRTWTRVFTRRFHFHGAGLAQGEGYHHKTREINPYIHPTGKMFNQRPTTPLVRYVVTEQMWPWAQAPSCEYKSHCDLGQIH